MKSRPRQRELFQLSLELFKRDRGARILTYISLFCVVIATIVSIRFSQLATDRGALNDLADMVMVVEVEDLQSQVLNMRESIFLNPMDAEQNDLQGEIELLEKHLDDLDKLPDSNELLHEIHDAHRDLKAHWQSLLPLLEIWQSGSQSPVLQEALANAFFDLQVDANLLLSAVGSFQIEISRQILQINQTVNSLAPLAIVGLLGFFLGSAALVNSLWRSQAASTLEMELLAKFPTQNPFPVMRFNQDYSVEYLNPASEKLHAAFGIRDGEVTDRLSRNWLEQAIKSGTPQILEVAAEGKVYSLSTSLLEKERQVTVYGIEVTERKQAEDEVKKQLRRIRALRKIDVSITSNQPLQETLDVVVKQMRQLLGVDAAAILVEGKTKGELVPGSYSGFRTQSFEKVTIRTGESLAGWVAYKRRPLKVPDLSKSPIAFKPYLTEKEGYQAYFAQPLVADKKFLGVLETLMRRPYEPEEEWLEYLNALAGQAAIAIGSQQVRDNLVVSNRKLRSAYDQTLEGWAKALELRDEETEGHSRRVTELTMQLAGEMGIAKKQLVDVRRGAILHDIGKMGIPDAILLKPGKLDAAEWEVMKKHPQYAYDMLWPIEFLHPSLEIPYAHHEKWDGSGYPRGLKGEEIPLAARIFAVVDVWDALCSDRPYRKAWSREKALDYIRKASGTHLSPRVVETFMSQVEQGKI